MTNITNIYQCCPICRGTGLVSRPPHIAGDQPYFVSDSSGPWPCNGCNGIGLVLVAYEREITMEHQKRLLYCHYVLGG
jgi:hypothetical protein